MKYVVIPNCTNGLRPNLSDNTPEISKLIIRPTPSAETTAKAPVTVVPPIGEQVQMHSEIK